MTSALNIIKQSLEDLGVIGANDILTASDAEVCRIKLNAVIDGLALGNFAYTSTEVTLAVAAGVGSLTIGVGGQVNVPGPVTIKAGSFSRIGPVDYPLRVIDQTEFNEIDYKNIGGYAPVVVAFNRGTPLGQLNFFPKFGVGAELHITVQSETQKFTDLQTQYTLVQGYEDALVKMLTIEIAGKFGKQPTSFQVNAARVAKEKIEISNFKVPHLDYPDVMSKEGLFIAG